MCTLRYQLSAESLESKIQTEIVKIQTSSTSCGFLVIVTHEPKRSYLSIPDNLNGKIKVPELKEHASIAKGEKTMTKHG